MHSPENQVQSLLNATIERSSQHHDDRRIPQRDIEYGLLAPPLDEIFPPAKKSSYYGERIKSLFGQRLSISVERLHHAAIAGLCLGILALGPLIPRLASLMGGLAFLIPVFQYLCMQKTLEATIQAGEYGMIGAVLGAGFSYGVASMTSDRWIRLVVFCVFGFALTVLDALLPPNPVRGTVPRMAAITSMLVLLAPNLPQALWQLCVRVCVAPAISYAVLLICFGLLAPSPSQAQLPDQFYHLLSNASKQLEHAVAQLSHAVALQNLSGREGSAEHLESWRVLHAARTEDRTRLAKLGGDARGRFGFTQELLTDARRQRFANVPLLQFYSTILQRIAAIESAYTAMRIAVGHQFAHTLEPALILTLHSIVHPFASMLQKRFRAVAARCTQEESSSSFSSSASPPIHESVQHLRAQYLDAIAKQINDVGFQAGAVAQPHLFMIALASSAHELEQLEALDWLELDRLRPSWLLMRLHLFFAAIAAPVIDLSQIVWNDFVLGTMKFLIGFCRSLFESSGRRSLLTDTWNFLKSNRWHFAFQMFAGFGVLQSVLFLVADHWPQYTRHRVWVAITALIVAQQTLGATVARGWQRIVGAAAAGMLGYFVASVLFAIHVKYVWRAILTELFSVPIAALCAYFWLHSRQPYLWSVVMITYILVVFGVTNAEGALSYAVGRTLSILIGILWAFLVAMFVFPRRAHHDLVLSLCSTVTAVLAAGQWVRRATIRWIVEADGDTEDQRRARIAEEKKMQAEIAAAQREMRLQQLIAEGDAVPRPAQQRTEELVVKGQIAPPDASTEAQAQLQVYIEKLRAQMRAQQALLMDASKERWHPPQLPSQLQGFFNRALVLLQCAVLVLRADPPVALQEMLANHMAESAVQLNQSIRHAYEFICDAIRNKKHNKQPDFTSPSFAMHQLTRRLDTFLLELPRAVSIQYLDHLLLLCARVALMRDMLREWQSAVDLVVSLTQTNNK